MNTSSPRRLAAADVRRFFEEHLPCSFCTACVAFNFKICLEEARAIALELTNGPGYIREDSNCDGCGRRVEVISVGRKHRRP